MTNTELHPSPVAQRTLDHLLTALEGSSTAGLADIVKLVQVLSSDSADISIHQLAEIIEKDAVVTTKCISAANKLGYNTHGVEIATIPQAIQVVGFNKIRSLAVSLLLLQNAAALNQPEPQLNTKVSLCVGLLCRAWAQQFERVDPDRHFLGGSLRNFGRLLASTHALDDYREASIAAAGGTAFETAFRTTFGHTPAELTHRLLARIALPAPILRSLAPFANEHAHRIPAHETEEIAAVSEFFLRYCEVALDPHCKPLEYHGAVTRLIAQFSSVQLTKEGLDLLLERVEKVLRIYGEGSSLAAMTGSLVQQIAYRRVPVVIPKATPPPAAEAAADKPSTQTQPVTQTLASAVAAISDELARPMIRLDRVLASALAGLADPWAAHHVVLFSGTGGSFRCLAQTETKGSNRPKPPMFRLADTHVLALACLRGEPVVIHDLTDPKLQNVQPSWFAEQGWKSCLLVPFGARDQCTLLAAVGWASPQRTPFTAEQVRDHKTLFNLISAAQRLVALQ